ncbi:alpha/beta fold hydrolase [Amycolatopsis sp. FDAARGOS 1241]|uniref:alpha/beta fold hydrolase n=1 Tax=Amycolatopsis sp. FDAARGOS 1241 TaxID=2778070 RepID=UPI0019505A92|nr:alpha/beta fold hydrolase [Amycolatopsis sp. FDAARGOS 1241]QRP48451.1 alpha/beta fold hydrolase [Amycolatopsis sp. FDAARGOS 1241]
MSGTIVLVHGSWHGSWCWDPVVPLLTGAGHGVTAVDLPGRGEAARVARFGLDDFADAVVGAVRAAGEPVTLVAHSMGGVPVSRAAQEIPGLISGLLYVAAFVPRNGQTFGDLLAMPEVATSLTAHQVRDPETGTTTIPPQYARETFYGDCAPEIADAYAQRLVPETRALLTQPVPQTATGIGTVRRGYVECLRDRALPVEAQRVMHRAARIEPVFTVDSDHSPFASRPAELATLIGEFAAAA